MWLLSENGLTRYDGYTFRVFRHRGDDPGSISSSDVRTMVIDNHQNIIFRTANSICKYNPKTEAFVTLLPFTNQNYVRIFYSGDEGTWVITNKSLIRIDADSNRTYEYPMPGDFRFSDEGGFRFAGNNILMKGERQLIAFNIELKKYIRVKIRYDNELSENFKSSPIFFFSTKNGPVTFYSDDGFFSYDEKSHAFLPANLEPLSMDVLQPVNLAIFFFDRYLILTSRINGFYCMDIKTGRRGYIKLPDVPKFTAERKQIFGIYPDAKKNLWISTTNSGLFLFEPERQLISPVREINDTRSLLMPENTQFVFSDNQVLWFTSPGAGLFKGELFNPAFYSFNPLDKKDSGHNAWFQNIRSIAETGDGNFLIGTLNGLCVFDRKTTTFRSFSPPGNGGPVLESNPISMILTDRDSNIWFSCWDKKILYVLNHSSGKFITLVTDDGMPSLYSHSIRSMYLDSHGMLWLGSDANFLNRIDIRKIDLNKSSTVSFSKINGSKNNLLLNITFVIAENKKGQILIGSENGFYIYDYSTDSFRRFVNNPQDKSTISDDNVRSFCIDKKNRLWIGTKSGGLNYFNENTEKFISYKTENGLPDNSIFSIQEDQDGFLWLGTNKGLARFNPENASCRTFTPKDGIQNFEFNTNASCKTSDGSMVFGGINGFNIFHPDSIPTTINNLPVVVSSLYIFDRQIPLQNNEVHLKYSDNYLSFQFASLNYFRNGENQYAYQLVGLDNDWVYCGDRRYTSYANLAPGDYTFSVKSADYNGIWNETGTKIRLHIATAWWNTIYFRSLVVLSVFTIIYLIYLFRLRQSIKLQSIRNRIARDLHDEVGSNLSSIAIFSEVARAKSGQLKDDVKPLLTKISAYTQSSMEAISDIVWVINANNDRFENVTVRMRTLAAETFESLGCEITMDIDEKVNKIKMGMEGRKNLYLIYKEALNNIAKYAQCNKVSIAVKQTGKGLLLKITDNGVGFDINEVRKGNGLSNMNKRASALNGHLTIDTAPGKGTSLILEFIPG